MVEGLVVPTGLGNASALVRLILPEPEINPEVVPLLQSISVIYASGTQSFAASATKTSSKIPVSLTHRELECLHWAVRGKTNAEIGSILAISRHTVNTHIESAKTKLGVATRMQAAALAHSLGMLSIA
jgi:DNA-binding CsgD family transcriptional regulator